MGLFSEEDALALPEGVAGTVSAGEEGFDRRSVSEAVLAMAHRVERLPEYGNEEFVFPLTLERARASG